MFLENKKKSTLSWVRTFNLLICNTGHYPYTTRHKGFLTKNSKDVKNFKKEKGKDNKEVGVYVYITYISQEIPNTWICRASRRWPSYTFAKTFQKGCPSICCLIWKDVESSILITKEYVH